MARRKGGAALKIVAAVAIVAVVGGGGVLWAASSGVFGESAAVSSVELASAETRRFDVSASASGELSAKNQVELNNPLERQTTITELIAEGTTVTAGAVLVKLNTEELQNQLREEELQVISARNSLDQALSAVRIQESENSSRLLDAQLKVELANLALQRWLEGEVEQTREKNRIAIEKAERDLKRLQEKVKRSEELFAKQFLSSDELELDRIALAQAEADLKIAVLESEIYEKFRYPEEEKTKRSDVDKALAELDRTKEQNEINLRDKNADVEARTQQLRVREENYNKLKKQIDSGTIAAPSPGLVVYASSLNSDRRMWTGEGPLAVGRQVYPGEQLIVLPDTSEMVATVRVHESLAGRVRPGQSSTITVEAVGKTFQGTVESIGVLAESGGWRDPNRREYTVRITLHPGQEGLASLKPSMRCDARIILDSVENALTVPIQAVFSEGPVQFVYAPRGSRFERVPVRVGQRSDAYAQIVRGLEKGDQVLLRSPEANEILSEQWNEDLLTLAGYALDEKGQPTLAMPAGFDPSKMSGGPGGMRVERREGARKDGHEQAAKPEGEEGETQVEVAEEAPAEGVVTEAAAEGVEAPATQG